MTRAEIVAEARSWLNVPFRPRGRSRLGIDCLGLPVMIARKFAVPHVDRQDYSMWPSEERLILATLAECLVRVGAGGRLEGCVGAFAQQRLPCHVGIFSMLHGQLHVIHTRISPPRVIEQAWQPQHELRLLAAFSFPGLTD